MRAKHRATRNTLAKRIEATADISAAIELAMNGKPLDWLTQGYLFMRHLAKRNGVVGTTRDEKLSAIRLAKAFFRAVNSGDVAALRSIADTVERYHPGEGAPIDGTRAHILTIKQILDKRGDTMPLAKLAALMKRPTTKDSLAVLGRLCRRLRFPLTQRAKGRPRKKGTDKAR